MVTQPDTWKSMVRLDAPGIPLAVPSDLPPVYADMLEELLDIWADRLFSNRLRYRYYDGKNALKDFGISTPPELLTVETVVDWPNKAVTALADRVRFDGFSAGDETAQAILDGVAERSRLVTKTRQATHSECIYGVDFATVGIDSRGKARIDLHSAETAAAVWDDAAGRIAYGMVIDDFKNGVPTYIRLLTDDATVHLWAEAAGVYSYGIEYHSMGRHTMEALVYRPTDRKPFGQSRISRAVMSITDSAVRCALGGDVAFQYAVAPQKYLLGVDRDPFEQKTRWESYIGNIFVAGYNNSDGVTPQFGQLPQPSMQPYSDYMRSLAARFSSATNIPISQLGVIHDQPASAEAIYAAAEPLIIEATDLIDSNRETMRTLGRLCVAAELDVPLDELTDEQRDVTANYRNPAMPSVVSMADAAVKIAGAVEGFAGTEYFWKMVGLPEDARREVEAETTRATANAMLASIFTE